MCIDDQYALYFRIIPRVLVGEVASVQENLELLSGALGPTLEPLRGYGGSIAVL